MPFELFDAFTALAALVAVSAVAALFLCTREIEQEERREWTLRQRRRM